ncbi:MAG: DHH family phosphoesterase [Deltaproteobacteria bacterium]|nr:DHH family phosphoesterase [Deltaproteobacteria bacterium]
MVFQPVLLPVPRIRVRPRNETVYQALLNEEAAPWLADLLARRLEQPVSWQGILRPALGALPDPATILGLDRAVARIVRAIAAGEKVIFACDHDLDGTASAAVLWRAFNGYFAVPEERLQVVTSHRLTEGYGLTQPVVERILGSGATLVITADKGSADEERIGRLKAAGLDVIVTDHHLLPEEGPPPSAFAVVNPSGADSGYDPHVCGAAVAFLVMAKVRAQLLESGLRPEIPSLKGLLDYVAVATVADCVALRPDRSAANRILVRHGLALLNEKKRLAWQVFCAEQEGPVTAETVAFRLAPCISASGRLDWPDAGFRFLIAADVGEAVRQWRILQAENEERRRIEKELRQRALVQASAMTGQSLVLYFEDGHCGVHGITASRLAEAFGKPAALFAPKGTGGVTAEGPPHPDDGPVLASGSFRGVPGFHVRDALQAVSDRRPGLLRGFGGHEGAAGATLAAADIPCFAELFEVAVRAQLGEEPRRPDLWVDGDWPAERLTLATVDCLDALDPWGKDFPAPVLYGRFTVRSSRELGNGAHRRLLLEKEGVCFEAVWFNVADGAGGGSGIKVGETKTFVYRLGDNRFRGKRSLQLRILALGDGEA